MNDGSHHGVVKQWDYGLVSAIETYLHSIIFFIHFHLFEPELRTSLHMVLGRLSPTWGQEGSIGVAEPRRHDARVQSHRLGLPVLSRGVVLRLAAAARPQKIGFFEVGPPGHDAFGLGLARGEEAAFGDAVSLEVRAVHRFLPEGVAARHGKANRLEALCTAVEGELADLAQAEG